MNLLLDTHAILWFWENNPMLSGKAKTAIEEPSNRKLVSLASCWEIAIKASSGKLQLAEAAASLLPREIAKNNFELLPIELVHATGVEALPFHHRDPFDRMLVAQALAEQLPIVSADALLDAYGITRLW